MNLGERIFVMFEGQHLIIGSVRFGDYGYNTTLGVGRLLGF